MIQKEIPDIPSTPVSPHSLPDQAMDTLLRVTLAESDLRLRLRDEALLAQRRFKALDGEWTSEESGRFFWLTPEDMLQWKLQISMS